MIDRPAVDVVTTRFGDGRVELHHGDCLDVLAELDDCSVASLLDLLDGEAS